jgi:alpha-tubulin suppressor-like RCC1 family protein
MASAKIHRSGKRKIGARSILVPLAFAAVLASCSDDGPTGHDGEWDDATDLFPGLTVSNPTGAATGFTGAATGGAAGAAAALGLAYVSALPGTFSDAETITITNLASGESLTVRSVAGGFDPVAVEAGPDDKLEILVEYGDGSRIKYLTRVPVRKRPRVVRTIPANGATDVVLSVTVIVVFSEPIDGATMTTEAVKLLVDGSPVEGTLELSDNGVRARFTPAEPLQQATSYSLVITTGLLDLQGDPLELEVQATFTTGSGILSLDAENFHACAVDADGSLVCWGDNGYGICGQGSSVGFQPPKRVPTTLKFTSVALGHVFTCGLAVDGEAYCWGWNYWGQLGDGTRTDSESPVRVSGGHRFVSLTASSRHACGVTSNGIAYCWGAHDYLQLGPSRSLDSCDGWLCSTTPVRVGRFESLTAYHLFTCGLKSDGTAWCWGADFQVGNLGSDPTMLEACALGHLCSRYPVPVSGGHRFVQLSASPGHACGLTSDGAAHCWGANNAGQLGVGFTSEGRNSTPLAVLGGHSYVSIAAGGTAVGGHTCALAEDGRTFCWGSNSDGQLGTGGPLGIDVLEPLEVTGSHYFEALTSGGTVACAATSEGDLYCWGSNYWGELGHDPSSLLQSISPLLVPMP